MIARLRAWFDLNVLLMRYTGLTEGQIAERWPYSWALLTFPRRTGEALTDPVRRLHLIVQVLVVHLNATLSEVALCWWIDAWPHGWRQWVGFEAIAIAVVVVDYLRYEYLLEPWSRVRVKHGKPSLVRPYWEGGPRDGERFIHE